MANVVVAYILWFFGGIFGLHHLYLGRDGQALIWWLSWGGYVLGWLGDSGRISQYVAEANESMDEKREKLQVLKKHHPKPEINYVTIGSYFMVGHLLSGVVVNAVPNTLLKAAIYGPFLSHLFVTLGTAIGTYIVTSTGPVKTSFLWPFLAAMCLFPVSYIYPGKQTISVVLTTAVGAYVSMECADWRKEVSEQDGHQSTLKRLAVVFAALLLHGSLYSSFLFFNVTVASMNGTQVPLREVMYNFMVTKPYEQTHDAMMDLFPCMRMYDLETCQYQFIRTLTEASDPTREDWAFKVLELTEPNPAPRKINSYCRKLSSKFHPDRHRNVIDSEKKAIEKKFLEIQQACGILNKIKMNRERKSKWSVSGSENWNKAGSAEQEKEFENDSDERDNYTDDLDNHSDELINDSDDFHDTEEDYNVEETETDYHEQDNRNYEDDKMGTDNCEEEFYEGGENNQYSKKENRAFSEHKEEL